MDIGDEKYVSFTTFRKNGEAKSVPVWIAPASDGTYGFTTPADSWKVKRLANDNRIQVQPSDSRGKITAGSAIRGGTAIVAGPGDAGYAEVDAAIGKKYGIQRTMIQAMNKARSLVGKGHANVAVIVTLD